MTSGPFASRWVAWVPILLAVTACRPVQTPVPTPIPSPTPTRLLLPAEAPSVKTPTPTRTPPPVYTPTPLTPTLSPPAQPLVIRSIRMVDPDTGWAVGEIGTDGVAHILRTTDGGETWRDVSPESLNVHEANTEFLDAEAAWVWELHGGGAWRTLDGGQSWIPLPDLGSVSWRGWMWYHDRQHGWKLEVRERGLDSWHYDFYSFATTQDGGQTWEETNPPPGFGIASMAFLDARTAWVVRANYGDFDEVMINLQVPFSVHTTFDAGRSWTSRIVPLPPETRTFEYIVDEYPLGAVLDEVGHCGLLAPAYSSVAIWKLSLNCESQSWLYTTANQGKTWIISPIPAGVEVDLEFVDPLTGWLFVRDSLELSHGYLYRTTDGGQSWTPPKRVGWADADLRFLDAQTGWAVAWACPEDGCDHYPYSTELVKTTDGGQTWELIEPQLAP